MITPFDERSPLPVVDLYDSNIMLQAIAAAKQDYDQARQDLKDFKKEYGDFLSPIQKDMDWYSKNVTGKVRDTINALYAAGIDPLRSAEGRAAVSRVINGIDTGRMARNKMSAANAEEYLKNKAKLQAAGLYNPDFEENFLNVNINDFSSENGVWDRLSPVEAKSLKSLTESSYDKRTPHTLSKSEVESFDGYTYDPRAKYTGFTENDLLNIANTVAPGLTGTIYADYYRDLAKRELIAAGNKNPSEADINNQLAKNIAYSNKEYLIKPIEDLSDYYKQEDLRLKKQANQIRQAGLALRQQKQQQDAIGWTKRQKTAIMQNFNQNRKAVANNLNASTYYGLLQTIPQGADKTTAIAFLAGISNPEQIAVGINSKRLPVTFGSNDLTITRKRQDDTYKSFAGNNRFGGLKFNSSAKAFSDNLKRLEMDGFDSYLKENHVEGFIPTTDVTVNYNESKGNDLFDINGIVRVEKADIVPYFKDNKRFISVGKDLGLVAILKDGRRVEISGKNKGHLMWDNIEYIDIPTTRSIESIGYGNSVLDTYHDVMTLGKGTATKRQAGYEDIDEEGFEY